jgi:Domain of unknown function (DUF1906)
MDVTYGADYSASELSPSELDSFTDYDIRFLIRYIGWPGNPRCISHYPGAYQAHVNGGRMVLLVAEHDTSDPAGGFSGGAAMAQRALSDALSVGYPDSLPIFFCADGWLAANGISVATAMSYLDGAASVVGRQRTGAYGFRDFIQAAKAGGHAAWLWLCGSEPTASELAQGWPHIYQWNNGAIRPSGLDTDLDWAYPGVLSALRAASPPAPAHSLAPASGQARPPWPDAARRLLRPDHRVRRLAQRLSPRRPRLGGTGHQQARTMGLHMGPDRRIITGFTEERTTLYQRPY